jgi:hypothetical protein
MRFDFADNYDFFNVMVWADGVFVGQHDDVHPDSRGYWADAVYPWTTYQFQAEACVSHRFSSSTCTGWDNAPVTTITSVPTRPTFTSGPFHLQFAHSLKCVDDPEFDPGREMDQWDCVDQPNEQWYLDYFGGFEHFRIRSAFHNNMCLNVAGDNYTPGARLILWRCDAYPNEYFTSSVNPSGTGYWIKPSAAPHLALNIAGNSGQNGANLILWNVGFYSNEYVRLY